MNSRVSNTFRATHKWIAIVVAVPLLFVLVTGIFLQLRKPVDWIQPVTERGSASFAPGVTPAEVLEAVRGIPEMQVEGWADLAFTDYRPRKGIIKVHGPGHWETQIDAASGAVIKTKQRWNDLVNHIHDGSLFGLRLWLFLPLGILTAYLLLSGLCLLATTSVRKLRRLRSGTAPRLARKPEFSFGRFCVQAHYWVALLVAVPWLVVIGSGLVLQLRSEIPGVLPALERGSATVPSLTYEEVLRVASNIPELEISGWSDVWRVYTYPGNGLMEIRTKHGISAQLDAATGAVLRVAPRATDFWEDVHQGIIGRHQLNATTETLFGRDKIDLSLTVFLPAHVIALFVLVTGVVFFVRKALPARRVRTEETPAAVPAAVPAPDNVVWLPVAAARAGANEAIEAESEEKAAEPALSRG